MATETKTAGKRKTKTERRPNVFHQRLGTLTYHQAVNLLGEEGSQLIRTGGRSFEIQSDRDVYLGGDLFRVRVEDAEIEGGFAIATITLNSDRK
ncbi:MAG: helicase, partial [Rhodopirellula bahusiensis]